MAEETGKRTVGILTVVAGHEAPDVPGITVKVVPSTDGVHCRQQQHTNTKNNIEIPKGIQKSIRHTHSTTLLYKYLYVNSDMTITHAVLALMHVAATKHPQQDMPAI